MAHQERPARLTIALAGHHPPLLIDGAGGVREVGEPGTLLGVIDPVSISEVEARLDPGATLVMYTDGVTEAGRPDRELGAAGLRELVAAVPGVPLDELLAGIEGAALERAAGSLHDDIALLAVRATAAG
jgi:serine phosphatase RsbU (regulator of sigma subunit)